MSFNRKSLYSHEDMEIQYDNKENKWYVLENGIDIISIGPEEKKKSKLTNLDMVDWAKYLQEEMGDLPFTQARDRALNRVMNEKKNGYSE